MKKRTTRSKRVEEPDSEDILPEYDFSKARRNPYAARYREGTAMITSLSDRSSAFARKVIVTADTLNVELVDGRTISVPIAWYPRLAHGTPAERKRWELIGRGEGIHWPKLDEDISVENLLMGARSGESQRSLKKWLESRRTV